MKACTKCGQVKPLDDYPRCAKSKADGRKPYCKSCNRAYSAEHYKKNVERYKVVHAAYYQRHVDERKQEPTRSQIREYNRQWRLANPGKQQAQRHRCWNQTRARRLVKMAKYRATKKGLPYDLDQHISALEQRLKAGTCELTGLPFRIVAGMKRKQWDSPSIDRIDPAKGYVYSNIRVVCWGINCAINHWGEDVLLRMVEGLKASRPH